MSRNSRCSGPNTIRTSSVPPCSQDAARVQQEKLTATDEFPYLVASDESVLSAFQGMVDDQPADSTSTLILCGSSIRLIESEVMSHESPLYGHRTTQIDLQPFSFPTTFELIDHSFADSVRSFAVTGGMPMDLTLFDHDVSLETNILNQHLSKTSILYNEPEFRLRTKLRDPLRYMSILEAIATGATTNRRSTSLRSTTKRPRCCLESVNGRRPLSERDLSKAGFEDVLSDRLGDRWNLFDLPSLSSVLTRQYPHTAE